jgi:hypothetical protein
VLKRHHVLWGAAILLMALIASGYLASWSPSYQQCEADNTKNVTQEKTTNFNHRISVIIVCEGTFANKNGSAIAALATIALVISTIGLWIVTGTAAGAAQASADAAITGQRPWVKIDIKHASDLTDDGNGVRLEFSAIVENVGATPATDVEAYVGMACGSDVFAAAYSKARLASFGGSVSVFPKDSWKPTLFGRITRSEIEAITPENLGKSSLIQAPVTVVAFVKYTFSGKPGQTVKTYVLVGNKMNRLLRVVDFSKVPIAKDDMTLERLPVFDIVS